MRLLRHFVPDVELDLKTMKAMIAEIEQGVEPSTATTSSVSAGGIETEESEVLREELGCMIVDARGSYRYVGADSYVRFANAVAQAATPVRSHISAAGNEFRGDTDTRVMVPLVRSRLPPATPETASSEPSPTVDGRGDRIYLPPRDVCQRYAMRFFDEIQSIYWFYSPEQFYTLVDRTYTDRDRGCNTFSSSWLCSLYSVFAICSAAEERGIMGRGNDDEKSSNDYLVLAKSMGLQVCDEADTDAVRALSLMSLALHSACFTVTAYLITGMAVRMAYSLGLHRNIALSNQDLVSRTRVHRLWWTLYVLDHEVAVQLGYPCAIVDHLAGIQTPSACESVLDPGRPTPHGYQAACVALIKLKKRVSHTLYVVPALSERRVVPFSAVTACLSDLDGWLTQLPPHLAWSTGMPPAHRRAVAALHLRYWTTRIYAQRPFLLYTATRRGGPGALSGEKKHRYEELSAQCLDAARKAVDMVRRMRDHNLLSSLVLFDSQCIQDLAYVFLLAKHLYAGRDQAAAASEGLEICLGAMRGMQAVGWCEKLLPELTAQVAAGVGAGTARAAEDRGAEGGQVEARPLAPNLEQRNHNTSSYRGAQRGGDDQIPADSGGGLSFQPVDDGLEINDAFFECFQDSAMNGLDVFNMLDIDMGTFTAEEDLFMYQS